MNLRTLRCLLPLAAALAVGTVLAVPPQQIDGQGNLHRVEAISLGKPAIPVLRHTMVRPDGTTAVVVIPGTNDPALDTNPAVAVDPVRGTVVLVWSRDTGSGLAVYVSRFADGVWSSPRLALDNPNGDEIDPQIQITPTLVHVVAHHGTEYTRVCLDLEGLEIAFGPEQLSVSNPPITPGVDPPTATPVESLAYFSSRVIQPSESDPGQIVIWGVRDEPVPIDYSEVMRVPFGVSNGNLSVASPIEGSLTATVISSNYAWYTVFQNGNWRTFGALLLDGTTSLSDVRALLADMIRRTSN
jgi:hypothetical protein